MGDFKHLVVVKFKPEVEVAEILKGIQDLMSRLVDIVKSFEWGEDMESHEMGRQGFTHVFAVTFRNKEDYNAYVQHPEHMKFSAVFAEAVDQAAVLDFLGMSVDPTVTSAPETVPNA
ncbi:hypothetical protein QQ045_026606 [Rhodiola kirilowii]